MTNFSPEVTRYRLTFSIVKLTQTLNRSAVVATKARSILTQSRTFKSSSFNKQSRTGVRTSIRSNIGSRAKIYTVISSNARVQTDDTWLVSTNATILAKVSKVKTARSTIRKTLTASKTARSRVSITVKPTVQSNARITLNHYGRALSNALVLDTVIGSYTLLLSLQSVKSIQSLNRLYVIQSANKLNNATVQKAINSSIDSRSYVYYRYTQSVSSQSAVTNEAPFEKLAGAAISKTVPVSTIGSQSAIVSASEGPGRIIGSLSSIVGPSSRSIGSNYHIQQYYLEYYELNFAISKLSSLKSNGTIENTLNKTIGSNFYIDIKTNRLSNATIYSQHVNSIGSKASIVSSKSDSKLSNAYVFDLEQSVYVDNYLLQFSLTALKAAKANASITNANLFSATQKATLIKTLKEVFTSDAFVSHFIHSNATIILKDDGQVYDDDEATYDEETYYDRYFDVIQSKASLYITVIPAAFSARSAVSKSFSGSLLSVNRVFVRTTSPGIESNAKIDPENNPPVTHERYGLFKFDLKSRSDDVFTTSFDLVQRENNKVTELSPSVRMKIPIRVFHFDVAQRKVGYKVFSFGLASNKIYKLKTNRTPVFAFDLQLRDQTG